MMIDIFVVGFAPNQCGQGEAAVLVLARGEQLAIHRHANQPSQNLDVAVGAGQQVRLAMTVGGLDQDFKDITNRKFDSA
jgi:hypothetical protein